MEHLRNELETYYRPFRLENRAQFPDDSRCIRAGILEAMDQYAATHPECRHPALLKARLHEEMAERFEPVIFPHSPFFFEMGLRFAECWGTPRMTDVSVGSWLLGHTHSATTPPEERLIARYAHWGGADQSYHLWNLSGFDTDHHSLGYTKLLRVGIHGLLAEIENRLLAPCTPHQAANLEAMARSCRAMVRAAERFGEKARALLTTEHDPAVCANLQMIADAAQHIPAHPPRTFYEGLAMLWFLREATATFEAIGVSIIGHPDRQLTHLYQADIAAGRLTETDARDLLARWMLPTDIKFHVDDNPWPETSTCLELGGCDEDGTPVWNDVTRLIIETHHAHHLINPKLNCRISRSSSPAYLDLISASVLDGHNHFALLNDDVLIPSCVRVGKTLQEARLYVNGGCQETVVEGVEHSAGAYYYYNMARLLDFCLQPAAPLPLDMPEGADSPLPQVITHPASFEDFYTQYRHALCRSISVGAAWARTLGRDHWQRHSCPFFSATLAGCIENGMDYTQGGAKYNPSGIALVGLGTVIDSLFAIKTAVFDNGWLSLEELQTCLAHNWHGNEALRARIRRLPHFGHGDAAVDALAARFANEVANYLVALPNERGGTFQGSFFVYYTFSSMGRQTRATPDGRMTGDDLTQGIAPNRHTAPSSLTDIFHTLSHVDFYAYPGNAVLDVMLPTGGAISAPTLSAVIRTFAQLNGPTLQLNCASVGQLRDAQSHPDRHRELSVRISGLSARFVCLDKSIQDEIIGRAVVPI